VLDPGEVHVWCAALDTGIAQIDGLRASLSADELKRVEALRFDQQKNRFVVRRAVLRTLVAQYVGGTPAAIAFAYGVNGKPSVLSPLAGGLQFNLSHSNGVAVFAFTTDREVGIDIEEIRPLPDAAAIAGRFFSPGEIAALERVNPIDRLHAFYNCWTRKEAYVKATGEGLQRPLDSFSVDVVDLDPEHPSPVHETRGDWRWSLRNLFPVDGFVGAVAARGQEWHLSAWRWSFDAV
jgi:4'-phosphopantetheinyl transferase